MKKIWLHLFSVGLLTLCFGYFCPVSNAEETYARTPNTYWSGTDTQITVSSTDSEHCTQITGMYDEGTGLSMEIYNGNFISDPTSILVPKNQYYKFVQITNYACTDETYRCGTDDLCSISTEETYIEDQTPTYNQRGEPTGYSEESFATVPVPTVSTQMTVADDPTRNIFYGIALLFTIIFCVLFYLKPKTRGGEYE